MAPGRRARRYLRRHPWARRLVILLAVAVFCAEIGNVVAGKGLSAIGGLVAIGAMILFYWAVRAGVR